MVELVDVALSDVSRRSRTLQVSHEAAGLRRGLDPGESLLVRDGEDFYSAEVADIEFELDDTVYTLTLGGRVPEDLAAEQLTGTAPEPGPHGFSVHDVVRLLGKATSGRVPSPREPGHHTTDR